MVEGCSKEFLEELFESKLNDDNQSVLASDVGSEETEAALFSIDDDKVFLFL